MEERIFTVEAANALVGHLEQIFEEIGRLRTAMERHRDRLEILDLLWGEDVKRAGNPDRDEYLTERAGVRRTLMAIERTVEEDILSLGVRFPPGGIEHGLVDFPTTLEGRMVFLCWKSGEPEIEWWHEVEAGYRGRVRLTPAVAASMGRDDRSDDRSGGRSGGRA